MIALRIYDQDAKVCFEMEAARDRLSITHKKKESYLKKHDSY